MLKIKTTHLKEDYLRRNGVPVSDRATMTEYLMRRGDYLTWVTVIYDPTYLTEPLVRSTEYRVALQQQIPPYPCTVVDEVVRAKGVVPHHLPGTNPYLNDFPAKYKIAREAARGGAETMYPEYRKKIRGNP